MSDDYDRFHWKETLDGVWTRDVDEAEEAYTSIQRHWRGSARSFFHVTGHVSLQVAVQPHQSQQDVAREFDAAAAKAWMTLRFHYPTIASQVELNHKARKYFKVYRTSTDGWLEKTFKVVSTHHQTGIEWANDDPPCPPLPTLNIVKPPTDAHLVGRDFVLRSPHDVIDGMGTLLLFDNYVRLVAQALREGDAYQTPSLDDPQVIRNLSPPFRVAAGIPSKPSERTLQRLSDIAQANTLDEQRGAEVVSLPFKKGALVPGVHKREEILLPAEETAKLAAACKAIGATVTHVFHAAIAIVLRDLQTKSPAPRPVEYVGYLLRNERPSCQPPYNDHRHAAAVYHLVSGDKLIVKLTVPSEGSHNDSGVERAEFLRIVDEMKRFYFHVRDDPDHTSLAPLLWARMTSSLPALTGEADHVPPVPPPADVASVSISSMGRIDAVMAQKHGDVEVFHPWVTGEELRTGMGVFLGTFRGELSLSVAYNDAWHGKEGAELFLRRCLEVVRRGLSLE